MLNAFRQNGGRLLGGFRPSLVQNQRRLMSVTCISFKNVSYEYGHDKTIIDDASFSIEDGSKVTIMGQNGAGKVRADGELRCSGR
jgi:ATPase subunit of ABC transporter with duplicated ATPase domains